MEGKKAKPRALFVFGAPCSGKTTFAKKFAEKFGIAYYNLNEIQKKFDFSSNEILYILELLATSQQTMIIDGGVDTESTRRAIKHVFLKQEYETALIWVQTDVATIRARMKLRYKSVAKAKSAYDIAVGELEAPSELEHPIILSGKHTFETQTKHVLAGLADVDKR